METTSSDKLKKLNSIQKFNLPHPNKSLKKTRSLSRSKSNGRGKGYIFLFNSSRAIHNYGKKNEINFQKISSSLNKRKKVELEALQRRIKQRSHKHLKMIRGSTKVISLKKSTSEKIIKIGNSNEGRFFESQENHPMDDIPKDKKGLSEIQSKKFDRMLKKLNPQGKKDDDLITREMEIKKTIENLGKEEPVLQKSESKKSEDIIDEYGMEKIKRQSIQTQEITDDNKKKHLKNYKKNVYTKNYIKKKIKQSSKKISLSQDISEKRSKKLKKIAKPIGKKKYLLISRNEQCGKGKS